MHIPLRSAIGEALDTKQEAEIGHGDHAISTTVQHMAQIINLSSKNPLVREWARTILAGVMVNAKHDEAQAIHNFVRDHIRYTRDPYGWEYIQTPPVLLGGIEEYLKRRAARPIGDCDDMTVLSLSLMKSVGFPVVIKTVGYNGRFSHVYGMVHVNGKWIVTDTVRPDKWFGWEAPGVTRVMEVQA
ncbi:transglutaminase domain-containing protein [Candidatus Gracilibacteria bacterium]|nr:transglutaminase domain-containing protein [Candidatus Gracilibacteria bacterium]